MDKQNNKQNLDDYLGDHLLKIGFHGVDARLILVRLQESWLHIKNLQQESMQNEDACILLGEAIAASCLLASNIKLDGSISFQIRGQTHALELLVAESTHEFGVRGVIKLREAVKKLDMTALIKDKAYLVVNILPKNVNLKPYQGIIPLSLDINNKFSMQNAIAEYMQNSEQIDTHLWLAADKKNAFGMLLQKMPNEGGYNNALFAEQEDAWLTLKYLAETLKKQEMLDLPLNEIVLRLFHSYIHSDALKIYEEAKPCFYCTCSLARAENALRLALSKTSVDELMNGDASLNISCDFCGNKYIFNRIDCEKLC